MLLYGLATAPAKCTNAEFSPKEINVDVNVSVYSLKSPLSSADFTIYALGIETLSYTVSSFSGENSAFAHFAAAIANHYNLVFSFHQVPITAGWTEAA